MADALATPSARLTMILGVTAIYLGLAVLGWGGFSTFFSHPALIALALATCAISAGAFFAGGNLSTGVREDRANRWVIAAFAAIGLLFAYLPAWTDRNELWIIDGDAVRWLGVVLFAAGGALRIWPVHALGNRFSGLVAIQPGHTLLTTGIYGVIRHPSYLGLLINALGWGLASVRKKRCCALSLAPSTTRTAPGHHGSFQASFEVVKKGVRSIHRQGNGYCGPMLKSGPGTGR